MPLSREHFDKLAKQIEKSMCSNHRKHLYMNVAHEFEARDARIAELEAALLAIGVQVVQVVEKNP